MELYGTLRTALDNIDPYGTIRPDKVGGLLLHRSYLPSTPRRGPPCGEGFFINTQSLLLRDSCRAIVRCR